MRALGSSSDLALVLLLRGLTVDRSRPDLDSLGAERDPERFVQRMLPHAARSFAASIVMLPRRQARAASVAYLYCRMLDTYEDLLADPAARVAELTAFGARFADVPPPPPPPLTADAAGTDRDRVHLLLVERCALVDEVYADLDPADRELIAALVGDMAAGMVWATRTFAEQGGVLVDAAQLTRYCRAVIGLPTVFLLELVSDPEFTEANREDAMLVSEMVQLANVTRDIEADLERGVGYHPALLPFLGAEPRSPEAVATVREVRRELIGLALSRTPAYRRMYEGLALDAKPSVRAAAIVLLLFTSLHYRGNAASTGYPPWRSPRSRGAVLARGAPCLLTAGTADRTLRAVERDLLKAAADLAPGAAA